jgi:hypothetical protein
MATSENIHLINISGENNLLTSHGNTKFYSHYTAMYYITTDITANIG